MKIGLAYGKKGLEWNIPDGYHVDVIEPQWVEGLKDQAGAITDALRSPIESKPLKDLVSRDSKIGIIFSDVTRATPYHIILPALLMKPWMWMIYWTRRKAIFLRLQKAISRRRQPRSMSW